MDTSMPQEKLSFYGKMSKSSHFQLPLKLQY